MNDLLAIEVVLEIVVPVIAGLAVLWLARRTPSSAAKPAPTALFLFIVLVVMAAFMSPGGDLITPVIGGIVSAAVCAAVYLELRRRRRLGPT